MIIDMTKEEILKRNVEAIAKCNVSYNITNEGILNAMDEYSAQLTSDNAKKDAAYNELKQLADEMAADLRYVNGMDTQSIINFKTHTK